MTSINQVIKSVEWCAPVLSFQSKGQLQQEQRIVFTLISIVWRIFNVKKKKLKYLLHDEILHFFK